MRKLVFNLIIVLTVFVAFALLLALSYFIEMAMKGSGA